MATTKPPQKLLAEIGTVDVQKMKHVETVEENSLPSAEGRTAPLPPLGTDLSISYLCLIYFMGWGVTVFKCFLFSYTVLFCFIFKFGMSCLDALLRKGIGVRTSELP